MSIWTRIAEALAALRKGEPLSAVFDRLRSPPEQSVAFTIAVIALAAKMAKADGLVTRDEVTAFREVFTIAPDEEENAAKVFNMARQDVAGFEEYASRIAAMFQARQGVLCNLIEGLFHIAMADGEYHEAENAFLARVAEIFGLSSAQFMRLRAQFVPDAERDPYEVLGVAEGADIAVARAAWRQAVKESHPDRLIAQGLPAEAIQMAEARIKIVNKAWEEIRQRHAERA